MRIEKLTSNSSSFNYGSFFTSEELSTYSISGSSVNYPFGEIEKDVVEKGFYDKNGTLISWGIEYPDYNYSIVKGNYINLSNNKINYSYNRFNKSFETVDGKLVLSPAEDLKSMGYEVGSFQCVYLPIKNIVGDDKSPLIVTEISNNKKEIKISFKDEKLKSDYNDYINGVIRTKYVINDIINGLENTQITPFFQNALIENRETVDIIKQKYSFSRDSMIMFFVSDLYNGTVSGERKSDGTISSNDSFSIKNQISNFLYENYDSENTLLSIKNKFIEIVKYITNVELSKISNKIPTDDEINFFVSIFDDFFTSIITNSETNYKNKNFGLLKDVINFGNFDIYPIVNKAALVDDSTGEMTLLVLLESPISDVYKENDKCWISNISPSLPIFQNIYLYKETTYIEKKLRGPNFSVTSNQYVSSGTEYFSNSDLFSENTTGSLSELIENYYKYDKNDPKINVDYTDFSNFIKFSSATTRLENFERKLNNINSLSASISNLEGFEQDSETLSDIDSLNSQMNDVIGSFDGYEKFLYKNQSYVNYESASLYDEFNNDMLKTNTPSFITENENNSDYIKFLDMVGHMFDDIWTYIKNLPSTQPTTNDGKTGNTSAVLPMIMESNGWISDIGNDYETLSQILFSKSDFGTTDVESQYTNLISSKLRSETIWRRLLVNLPNIIQSLGTQESIRYILSCYGIPRYLMRIKEYGGIVDSENINDTSIFKYDSVYYAVKFQNGNEYIQIPWDNGEKTIEFKLRFDPTKTNVDGNVYRLLNCDDRWAVGVVRTKSKDWGKFFFSISNNIETKTLYTEEIPVFNGSLFNVMVREGDESNLILGQSSSMDLTKYDLYVNKVEDSKEIFLVSGSLYLDTSFTGSYQTEFGTSSLKFGNHISSGSVEEFYGNIDQIKTWKNTVSYENFKNHSTVFDSLDIGSKDDVIDNIVFRLNFEYPTNLYSSSNFVTFENSSPVENELTSSFNYFPAPTTSSFYDRVERVTKTTEYPYQFDRFEDSQEIKIPNFGGSRYDSEKIRKIDLTLSSDLSSYSKASSNINKITTIDNNNLGIYLSPTDQINDKIFKLFGGIDFQNLIGSPDDIYSSKYKDFELFKRKYNKYIQNDIDFNSFMNLVKGYVDKSVFDNIKKSVPAKANIVTGILIEPTILERTKIESKPIEIEIHNNFKTEVDNIQKLKSALPPQPRTKITIPIVKGVADSKNFNGKFVDAYPDRNGYGVFAINGFTVINGENYYVEIVKTKVVRQVDVKNRVPVPSTGVSNYKELYSNGSLSYEEKFVEKISMKKFTNTSEITVSGRPLHGYFYYHHKNQLRIPHTSTKRISTSKIFIKNQQTEETTVDETGNLNGDLPFYTTVVDRGRSSVTSQGNQNVLESGE